MRRPEIHRRGTFADFMLRVYLEGKSEHVKRYQRTRAVVASGECQRFVISDEVREAMFGMWKEMLRGEQFRPMDLIRDIVLPAKVTWIECHSQKGSKAVLFEALDDTFRTAHASIVAQDAKTGTVFLEGRFLLDFDTGGMAVTPEYPEPTGGAAAHQQSAITFGVNGVFLAFINSPKIVEKSFVDRTELNALRLAKPKLKPLVSYHDVKLSISARSAVRENEAAERGDRRGRALHHVRTFFRVRLGRVEMVKGHWRGSAENGTRLVTRHVMT